MSFTKFASKIGVTTTISAMFTAGLLCAATPAIGGESGLDEEKLKSGLASRIEAMSQQQSGQIKSVSAENIRIEQVEPTSMKIGDEELQFYAVKAALNVPDSQASDIMVVVDEDANYQLSVQEVDSGRSPFQAAEDKLQRREIDTDKGQAVYSGSGEHELVVASSPFCSYCRTAFEFFKENKGLLSEWRVLHLSNEEQPAASAAVWAMMDSEEVLSGMDILDFVYTELEPTQGAPKDQIEGVIAQFMEKFPELEEKWGTPEQARYYLEGKYSDQARKEAQYITNELQVQATPTAYIDGVPVQGWEPSRYENLLGNKENEKQEG